ncbi:MAG TPA: hypothetical protein VFK44_09420 [Bacillales bacterium]|nr:hypothetical protein [Bacillales bacterium]
MRNKDLQIRIDKFIGSRPVSNEADKQRVLQYIRENTNHQKPKKLFPRFLSTAVNTSLFVFVIGFFLIQSGLILDDEEIGSNPSFSHDSNNNHSQQNPVQRQESYHFVKMKMNNKNVGWAMNQQNHIFRTENAWQKAKDITPKELPDKPTSMKLFILNQKTASIFVLESNNSPIKMFMTNNGGNTWRLETLSNIDAYGIEDVFFQNEKEGWLYTSKFSETSGVLPLKLYYTNDGGHTWEAVESNNLDQSQSKWVYFMNEEKGWSIGQKGLKNSDGFDQTTTALYETNDGGHNWTRLSLIKNRENSIFIRKPFSTGKTIILPIIYYNAKEREATFSVFQYGHNDDKWSYNGNTVFDTSDPQKIIIDFLNPSNGWVVVDQKLYRSANGGRSWGKIANLNQFNRIYDLQVTTETHAYLLTDSGLYISTDGGKDWIKQNKAL